MPDRSHAVELSTIMMTDVVGSTALRRARGDRDANIMLALQAAIVREQVDVRWPVRKSLGDGFSSPSRPPWQRSDPPSPSRALREHSMADPQRAVEIRVASTGRVTEHDGDLFGQTVHATARMMVEAVGGQILTSDEVRKHAEPQVDQSFLDLGLFWLRGFPERWRLYEVSWTDTSAGVVEPSAVRARPSSVRRREAERASLRRLLDDTLVAERRLALVAGRAGRRQVAPGG